MLSARLLAAQRHLHLSNFNGFLVLHRTYLSQEFKKLVEQRLPPPSAEQQQQLQQLQTTPPGMAPTARKQLSPSAVTVNFYAHRQSAREDHHTDICEQLLQLRASEQATNALASTDYAVIQHFVETGQTRALVDVLWHRLEYGIFVDHFTGCYLMDHLLEGGDAYSAACIGVEHMLQEDFDSELVTALALLSCYKYVQKYVVDPTDVMPAAAAPAEAEEATKGKDEVKKVRVKFLRNYPENDRSNDKLYQIGQTLLKMSATCKDDVKLNATLLGHLLCDEHKEAAALLQAQATPLHKDVLQLSLQLLKDKTDQAADLLDIINGQLTKNAQTAAAYDAQLQQLVKAALQKEEKTLIASQNSKFQQWTQEREDSLKREVELKRNQQRQTDIKDIMQDLSATKQKLWFFELEDKLDLEIYQKKPVYRKRWFGKKKKPKVIDDDYVPPEIIRKD